jgi:formylglycine-generating enzyme required for sulfatase activity
MFSSAKKINTVHIRLFDILGKQVFSREFTNTASNVLTVPLHVSTAQVSLIKLTIDNDSYTAKCINGISMNFISGRSLSSNNSPSLQKNAAAVAFVDSLIVYAQGWKNRIIPLSSYTETINTELTASNPWKPNGNLTHDKGMVKILAKDHDFEMGQAQLVHVDDSVYSEQPAHTVTFTYDFWMDTAEITQKQYDDLIKKHYPAYQVADRSARYGIGDNIPVYYVYWEDAVLYCNLKSKDEGLDTVYTYSKVDGKVGEGPVLFDVASDITKNGYRLPTEAEWEYACRGGTSTDFFWNKNYSTYPSNASDSQEISRYVVWDKNSEGLGEGTSGFGIHEIGKTLPNAYGLYDMAGNLSEHVNDVESNEYSYGVVTDPTGPTEQSGSIHMVRGGNWTNDAVYLRSASRNLNVASYPFFCVGFRAVRTVK